MSYARQIFLFIFQEGCRSSKVIYSIASDFLTTCMSMRKAKMIRRTLQRCWELQQDGMYQWQTLQKQQRCFLNGKELEGKIRWDQVKNVENVTTCCYILLQMVDNRKSIELITLRCWIWWMTPTNKEDKMEWFDDVST